MPGKRDTSYSPELSFQREVATTFINMPQFGVLCLRRILPDPAAAAATYQHKPLLGTVEPRA